MAYKVILIHSGLHRNEPSTQQIPDTDTAYRYNNYTEDVNNGGSINEENENVDYELHDAPMDSYEEDVIVNVPAMPQMRTQFHGRVQQQPEVCSESPEMICEVPERDMLYRGADTVFKMT